MPSGHRVDFVPKWMRSSGFSSSALIAILLVGGSSWTKLYAGDDDLELTPPLDTSITAAPRLVNPTRVPVVTPTALFPKPTRTPSSNLAPIALESAIVPIESVSSSLPHAVLALPGLTRLAPTTLRPMPIISTADRDLTAIQAPASMASGGSVPTLDGPVEMRLESETSDSISELKQLPLQRITGSEIPSIPYSPPADALRSSTNFDDAARLTTRTPNTTPRRIEPTAPESRSTAPITPRRRFFGLWPSVSAPSVANPASNRSVDHGRQNSTDGGSPMDINSSDGISEVRLRQRIEKQIREVVGDRGRTIEVHLTGRTASVQVSGVRFYQKRAVRRSIEAIPALVGIQTSINIQD